MAPKGNQYGLGNEDAGRPLVFETAEEWQKAIQSYFDWCDNNPIQKNEAVKSGIEAGRIYQVPTQRPYLIEGICDFLSISVQTFHNYEKKEGYEAYFEVSAWARNKCFKQNLEGGYTGGFDAGLVARKLGIADKQEMKAEVRQTQIIVRNDHEKAVMESVLSKE